ncbi:hypothetical protein L5515_009869 [Caenorhabditis briggsae]|uniref:DUF38 domain-containing protein n=1 Tax=Caenorhabditis briggsae TaxID=6238 RepID=A0AAE9JP89_CAEBR|nr:hypothetical protein L5515_009869 [Caenorhabditis briggsae]
MGIPKVPPNWMGLPPELREKVFSNCNVLERSILRDVSTTDRLVADKHPYFINEIFVLLNGNESSVFVTEGDQTYTVQPVSKLAKLLQTPGLKIDKIAFESGSKTFDKVFSTLMRSLDNIPKDSIHVKELVFYSEISFPGCTCECPTESSPDSRINSFFKLANTETLNHIKITTKLTRDLWKKITATEQWNNAGSISVENCKLDTVDYFNDWKGKHLKVLTSKAEDITNSDEWKRSMVKIERFFKTKPLGATMQFRREMSTNVLYAQCLNKIDLSHDANLRLYTFRGLEFIFGFVRPNDGTPPGVEACDPFEERRHRDWISEELHANEYKPM